ncbi:MAG: methyltransferase [Candidatus Marsarchaeota archaeon]|nr:methyltransferase [Candidatus Marsarchaeota archaeon]MCL5115181.1 methyltransferase [Candidatus Marsarchaeota archaeon]
MYVEGSARINPGGAFLNPKARFIRDVSVAFVASNAKAQSRILDATGGTGIRGIRYALESGVNDITILDINGAACTSIKKNTKANRVKAKVLNKSIQEFANCGGATYDFIDLDPFGGVSPYIYDIMKLAKDGTYLMLTATDTAVLCGAHRAACIRIYGSVPMHNELCHEAGIRILINYVATIAAQFNFGLEVKLSIFNAHYFRLFFRLAHGSSKALSTISQSGYLYYCQKCGNRSYEKGMLQKDVARRCCGSRMSASGRLWLGNLYDKEETKNILQYFNRRIKDEKEISIVETIDSEYDTPFFFSLPAVTKSMSLPAVSPKAIIAKLKEKGYAATPTQFDYSCIKTSATIKELMRCIKRMKNK